MAKILPLSIPNAGEKWSNRNFHTLLEEMQNESATLEEHLAVSYKTKCTLIKWSSNRAPWCLPKRTANYVHAKTHTHVLTSLHKLSKPGSDQDVGKWIKWIHQLWYIHMMKYYSMLKKKKKQLSKPWKDREEF